MREVTTWTGRETRALRKAMRLTIQAFAEHLDIAPRTVSYWESEGAAATTPRAFQQSMLDTAFSRLDDAAQDRFRAVLSEGAPPREPVQELTISVELPAMDFSDGPIATELATSIRQNTIVQLHAAADMFTTWDHRRGALAVSQAANAQIRWARSLLELPCPDPLQRDLYGAAAHLGLISGFVNFDAHCHDSASKIFTFAAACASKAGDPHLEAKLLSHQARQAIYCGMLAEAFPLLDRALNLPGLTATELAMLHTGRARAYAKQGRASETLAAVRAADDAFEKANSRLDSSWMAYYDAAQHLGDTGHALFDLAVEGSHEQEAIRRFQGAVAGHTEAYARSRAMSMIKLASLLMAVGDPLEATAVAITALPDVQGIGSQRVTGLLRELLRFSTTHRRLAEVELLRVQVSDFVAS